MRKLIGHIDVDSGMCWVGDPCYVIGEDSSHGVKAWTDFCDKLDFSGRHEEPLGKGVGFSISTAYGDGSYPVYLETSETSGVIERIVIEFDPEEEEEEA